MSVSKDYIDSLGEDDDNHIPPVKGRLGRGKEKEIFGHEGGRHRRKVGETRGYSEENRRQEVIKQITTDLRGSLLFNRGLSDQKRGEFSDRYVEWLLDSLEKGVPILYGELDDDFLFIKMGPASSKGGQHANKNATGAIVVHKVSGMRAQALTSSWEQSKREAAANVMKKLVSHRKRWRLMVSNKLPREGAKKIIRGIMDEIISELPAD